MKNTSKRIICALLSAAVMGISPMTAYAEEHVHDENCAHEHEAVATTPELYDGESFTDEVITYNKADGGVYVTGCNTSAVEVTIGEKIDGYKVLGIYDGAFAQRTNLRKVTLEEGMTYIGSSAFVGCEKLESVTLPEGITTVSDECFAGCSGLKEVNLPDSVTKIGTGSFSYCTSLENVKIPKTVTSVGDYAFAFSSFGESLELWEGLETLGSSSFYYCTGIKSVTIPSTLTSVGSLSFLGCESLEKFVVSTNNPTFSVKDGVLYSENETIIEVYPMGKTDKEFAVPETVQFIPAGAFFDNGYIEKLTMTDSVQAIDEGAFSNCTALREVVLSNSLTAIEGSAFCDCSALEKIEIPSSVTSIGDYAFLECTSLKSVTIPDTVKSIGAYAFGFTDEVVDEKAEYNEIDDFVIEANFETAAKDYAKEYGVDIDYLDGNKELPVIIAIVACSAVAVVGVIIAVVVVIKKKKKKDEYYKN